MTKSKITLPLILLMLLVAAGQTAQLHTMRGEVTNIAADTRAVQEQRATLQETQDNPQSITPLHVVYERQESEFTPLGIPLSEDLQNHTYLMCEQYGVPFYVILAIMENESRFIWQPAKMDANGLQSIGYMQINYPHWERLKRDYGVDVTTETGNIEGGVIILAELLEKYPLEKALVCYQCGETGANGINSTRFSRKILKRSGEFEDVHDRNLVKWGCRCETYQRGFADNASMELAAQNTGHTDPHNGMVLPF